MVKSSNGQNLQYKERLKKMSNQRFNQPDEMSDRIIDTCICGEMLEEDDMYVRIEDQHFCDWLCARLWIKKEFDVFEND